MSDMLIKVQATKSWAFRDPSSLTTLGQRRGGLKQFGAQHSAPIPFYERQAKPTLNSLFLMIQEVAIAYL
jgi:hypothetical protein